MGCINPLFDSATGKTFPCLICWQCKATKINDVVGRCIAEQKTTAHSHVATFTYGGDLHYDGVDVENDKARLLDYDDMSQLFRRLRHVAPFRYFVSGEYGTAKGRGHWHVIFFWEKDPPPNMVMGKRYMWDHVFRQNEVRTSNMKMWSEGFTFWQPASYTNFAYAAKYITKEYGKDYDVKSRYNRLHSMSNYPPLGFAYFWALARETARAGLPLRDQIYSFPDVKNPRTGKVKEFWLLRKSSDLYRHHYAEAWKELYGNNRWPHSEYMERYEDERARELEIGRGLDLRRYAEDMQLRHKEKQMLEGRGGTWPGAREGTLNRALIDHHLNRSTMRRSG